ncbi:MAG: class I SAM-dependent methyltransferase [Phormidesmis sp. RL_2_1]|nr:class I SAM-dependent methyltransferase [Phormidesmis sp. RL_2_1]
MTSSVINGLLSIKPLAKFAKSRARTMMMDRAESLGVYWRDEVRTLELRGQEGGGINAIWEAELKAIANPNITYPEYYTTSFHAYEEGNLGWLPAMEVDVAARAVHARIWPEGDVRAGVKGDAGLRAGYHQVLREILAETSAAAPKDIIDLGASAGRSTFTLQETFPTAQLIAVELSPYFIAVAQYAERQRLSSGSRLAEATPRVRWVHAPAEATGLPSHSADLVSACLVFHELPAMAACDIVTEAYRLVRPGGHFAIMDMDPQSETFMKMPPYVLTLLKSTEPYLDQYFALDMSETFERAGFLTPRIVSSSPRHRAIVGQKPVA